MAKQAVIETNRGTITIELFDAETPKTVAKIGRASCRERVYVLV